MPIRSGPSLRRAGEQTVPGDEGVAGQGEAYGDGQRQHLGELHRERDERGQQQAHRGAAQRDGARAGRPRRGPASGRARRPRRAGPCRRRPPAPAGGRRGRPAAGCRPRRARRRCWSTASPATSSRMTVRLASAFAAKIRRGDRTATSRWRQVPSRSSEAKTSPATSEVSSGSAQRAREAEHHQRPGPAGGVHPAAEERVGRGASSAGSPRRRSSAGASQQARSSRRIRHCESSLTSSKR